MDGKRSKDGNVFHAAKLKPASFADKYSQGCQISKQKCVLRTYYTYIVLNGVSLQWLHCFDYISRFHKVIATIYLTTFPGYLISLMKILLRLKRASIKL